MNLHEELAAKDALITTQASSIAGLKAQLAAALSRPVVAQPIDLSKLTRYVFRTGFKTDVPTAGMLPDVIGPYVMFDAVEELLAAAHASPQPVAKVLSEAMKQNMELVIARLQQIAWNDTDDVRTLAREALVCAEAVLAAASTPTTLTEKKE